MIELIWVVIAALGIWNVYVWIKRENSEDTSLAWSRKAGGAIIELQADIKTEQASREALEAKLAALEAAPIMMHPAFKEGMYQWMIERDAMEHDPEFIMRSQGGECGRNRPDRS